VKEFDKLPEELREDLIPRWVREWDMFCNNPNLNFKLRNSDLTYGPGEKQIAGAVEDWLRQQAAMAAFRRRLYGDSA